MMAADSGVLYGMAVVVHTMMFVAIGMFALVVGAYGRGRRSRHRDEGRGGGGSGGKGSPGGVDG